MIQELSIERVVTALAPLFASVASFLTGFVSQHLGLQLNPGSVAAVMSAAFLGTIWVVSKWLTGRQIPEIAGLTITPQQIAQLHSEIAAYLSAHASEYKSAEQEIATIVEHYLDAHLPARLPAPPAQPDPDQITATVLAKLPPQPNADQLVEAVLDRIRKGLGAEAQAGASPA